MKPFMKVIIFILAIVMVTVPLLGCDIIFGDDEETQEADVIKVRVTVTGRYFVEYSINPPTMPAKGLAVNLILKSVGIKAKDRAYEALRYVASDGTISGTATFYIVPGQYIIVQANPQGGIVINGITYTFGDHYDMRYYEDFESEIPKNAEDYTCIWEPILSDKGIPNQNPAQVSP